MSIRLGVRLRRSSVIVVISGIIAVIIRRTSAVTDMSGMFMDCCVLQALDVSMLDTQNVRNMSGMFVRAVSLTRLDVSGFDFNNVHSMYCMFSGDSDNPMALREVVMPTERMVLKGTVDSIEFCGMTEMFSFCPELVSVDLSCFDASAVQYMVALFYGCEKLESVNLNGFTTRDVLDLSFMFSGCSSLTSLDLSGMSTAKATNMMAMFEGCSALTAINLGGSFAMDSVTHATDMFVDCSALLHLDLSAQDTSELVSISNMFRGCSSLQTLNVAGKFSVASVVELANVFWGCTSLRELDLSTWILHDGMGSCPDLFRGMTALETIYVGDGWVMPNAMLNSHKLFYGCVSLVGGNGFTYDDSLYWYYEGGEVAGGADGIYAHIDGVNGPGYFTHISQKNSTRRTTLVDGTTFNATVQSNAEPTSIVFSTWNGAREAVVANGFRWGDGIPVDADSTGLIRMFLGEGGTVYVLGLKNDQIYANTDCSMMFAQMGSLKTVDFRDFRTDFMEDMSLMFGMCISLEEVDMSGFITTNLKNITVTFEHEGDEYKDAGGPFVYCLSLKKANISGLQFGNLKSIGGLFAFCGSLEEIVWPQVIDTSNAESIRYMFWGCAKLDDKDLEILSRFNTESLVDMAYSFTNCTGITVLDISTFSNESLAEMTTAFWGCTNLEKIYVGDLWSDEMSDVAGGAVFYRCFKLVGEQGTVYDDYKDEYYDSTNNDDTVGVLGNDAVMARVDGGADAPGYFTHISNKPEI